MDDKLIKLFQHEVKKQCLFVITATSSINLFFENKDENLSTDILWYHIQSFLVSTANISKLLWGVDSERKKSREPLRKSLDIKNNSVLYDRKFRNNFEHYDEKIEDWFENSASSTYVDSNVGPIGMISDELDTNEYLRNFDPTTVSITFKGKEYKIQPIVDEVIKLHKKADELTSFKYSRERPFD